MIALLGRESSDCSNLLNLLSLYIDGVEEGEWKTFWDNGQLQSVRNYLQGKLNGKYTYYYKDGSFWNEEFYKNGIKQ